MKFGFACVLAALLTSPAWADVDRILSVRQDGVIPELPATYGDTRLHIEYAKEGGVRSMRFVSAGRETSIERCVLDLLPKATSKFLVLEGSWYHDLAAMPPYVAVSFQLPGATSRLSTASGLTILFNLRDASVLGSPSCKASRKKAIATPKLAH